MANVSRVGGKKSAKKAKKKAAKKRKSQKRVAQGKRLARFRQLQLSGMSKREAKAEAFGHRTGGKTAKAKAKRAKAKAKKAGGKKVKRTSRMGAVAKGRLFDAALETVKLWNGTKGMPATAAELYQAEELVRKGEGYSPEEVEESLAEKAAAKAKAEAKRAAAKIVAIRREERERKEAEAEAAALEAEIERTAKTIL